MASGAPAARPDSSGSASRRPRGPRHMSSSFSSLSGSNTDTVAGLALPPSADARLSTQSAPRRSFVPSWSPNPSSLAELNNLIHAESSFTTSPEQSPESSPQRTLPVDDGGARDVEREVVSSHTATSATSMITSGDRNISPISIPRSPPDTAIDFTIPTTQSPVSFGSPDSAGWQRPSSQLSSRSSLPRETLRGLEETLEFLQSIPESRIIGSDIPDANRPQSPPSPGKSGTPTARDESRNGSRAGSRPQTPKVVTGTRGPRGPRTASIDTINLVSPDSQTSPKPVSPGMKHWQQVRQHVLAPAPEDRPVVGVPPRGKKLGLVSKAAGRLGFRNAVENVMGYDRRRPSTYGAFDGNSALTDAEREEASRERRRFARDIKACLDSCAAEESARRMRRIAAKANPAGTPVEATQSSKQWSIHHSLSGGLGRGGAQSIHNQLSTHKAGSMGAGSQLDVGSTFSAFAPLLTELHRHLPDARVKRVWSRTCPHHAAILAELGVTFLPDSSSSDGERAQVLEVFGAVVRNWATDSAEEELARWLWLCRAMLVDDRQLRNRGLNLLAAVLRRDQSIPESYMLPSTVTDFECLAIALLQLLNVLEYAPYLSEQHQSIVLGLLADLASGEIIAIDGTSVTELTGEVMTSDGIEPEILWLAVARAISAEPQLAGWLLDRNGAVLKGFVPPPILGGSPPLVLRVRLLAATTFFTSLASLVRTNTDPHIVPAVAHLSETIFTEAASLRAPLEDAAAVVSGYIGVLIALELWHQANKPEGGDPFTPSPQVAHAGANRDRLLHHLGTVANRDLDSIAEQMVATYPLDELLPALRQFLDSDLATLGRYCVPHILNRLSPESSSSAGVKLFLSWLQTSHPQLFYKPLFSCAAATQATSLSNPLRTVRTLSALVGPNEFWVQADPQMIMIVLVGAPRVVKGKGKEGSRGVVAVKLGRYAVLTEIILAVRGIQRPTDAGSASTAKLKTFLTTLETRLSTMLEVEEREGPLPNAYRSLVCQLLRAMRVASGWVRRIGTTRLAVAWYGGDGGIPHSAAALDLSQVQALRGLYDSSEKHKAVTAALEVLDAPIVDTLSSLLVTIQASLTPQDWGQLLPIIWERYALPGPKERATFLLMKCAEAVPGGLRERVTTDLFNNTSPTARTLTLVKLATLYGYRFQVLTQPTVTDRSVFKFYTGTLEYVPAEMGSAEWVMPREAHDATLEKYGRSLPLELRQRLMELGWVDDGELTAADYERVPVALLPPSRAVEAGRDGTGANPTLRRVPSNLSTRSTTKSHRAVLPPILVALVNEQARLLRDVGDVNITTLSFELVRLLEREDASAFSRPATEHLHTDLVNALGRLNAVIDAPTPNFAYVAMNALVGYLKMSAGTGRKGSLGPNGVTGSNLQPAAWALILGTISRLVPHVSELSLRDVRKTKAEPVLLPASIYEDEGGFKLHGPWRDSLIDVQTAQLVVLADMLRANPRDVYLVKKMLFNLQVQASVRHLPFARAWLELVGTLFAALNSNYNDRAELRHFVHNIASILQLHGTTDMIVAAHAMRALALCSARFRRVFASISFVDTMRTVYTVYVHAHAAIRDAIQVACRSFYRIHQDVFVYQLCLAIGESPFDPPAAYELLTCLSLPNGPTSGVASGLYGLNDKYELEALVQMVAGGAEFSLSDVGTRAAERHAARAANMSLEPALFPRENIIRLLVTVIAVNAASARALKFISLLAALVPHLHGTDILPDSIDAIGRLVHKAKAGDESAILRFLPGDEADEADWPGARREYLCLVDAYANAGGELSINSTRRVLDIVLQVLHSDTGARAAASTIETASSILGAIARTHLVSRHPIDFLRNLATAYRLHMASVDFSGVLTAITDLIKRSNYTVPPELASLVVSQYLSPAIQMLGEGHMAFSELVQPMRTAVVDLLTAAIYLRRGAGDGTRDALSALEAVPASPGLLAGFVVPLALALEPGPDVEVYAGAWVRLLRLALRPSRRKDPKVDPPSLAATSVLSLQLVKIAAVRAPECISAVPGLWSYLATHITDVTRDGDARFAAAPESVVTATPRIVDWMLWSTAELLAFHRCPLHVELRLRIQRALSESEMTRSRPSSVASDRDRRHVSPGTPISPIAGLLRRPSAWRTPNSTFSSPNTSLNASLTINTALAVGQTTPTRRMASGSSAFSGLSGFSRRSPITPRIASRRHASPGSSGTPSAPGPDALASSSTAGAVSQAATPASPLRPSFAVLSARRASRPALDVFVPARRFPSANARTAQGGAIVHLLGPAASVSAAVGVPHAPGMGTLGGASGSTSGAGEKQTQAQSPGATTRAAVREMRVATDEMARATREALARVRFISGYDDEDVGMPRVWSADDALHVITEQTKLLVEHEFRSVFKPRDEVGLDLAEMEYDDDDDDAHSKYSKNTQSKRASTVKSFYDYDYESIAHDDDDYHDKGDMGAFETHNVPIVSISHA